MVVYSASQSCGVEADNTRQKKKNSVEAFFSSFSTRYITIYPRAGKMLTAVLYSSHHYRRGCRVYCGSGWWLVVETCDKPQGPAPKGTWRMGVSSTGTTSALAGCETDETKSLPNPVGLSATPFREPISSQIHCTRSRYM